MNSLSLTYLLLTALLAPALSLARRFSSRDASVRGVIANCTNLKGPQNPPCHPTLQCILQTVPADYSARWSAGASILAFIPTIVGLMSNSIDEIVLVAEESAVLAVLLSLCSVTAFVSRFGERSESQAEVGFNVDSAVDALHYHLREIINEDDKDGGHRWRRRRRWERGVIIAGAAVVLMTATIAVWYSVFMVAEYGIVVYSCSSRIHVPLWAVLTQATTIVNVVLKKYTSEHETVVLRPLHSDVESAAHQLAKRAGKGRQGRFRHLTQLLERASRNLLEAAWPKTVILRSSYDTMFSHCIRLLTSILSFSLYAFGTGILAGITMFPASDGVRVMVLVGVSAGVGRLVGAWAGSPRSRWKKTIVIDVLRRYQLDMKEKLQRMVEGGVE
jgi:hypothetical protein